MIVAIDTMGGDNAPFSQIEAGISAIDKLGVEVIFLGDEKTIKSKLKDMQLDSDKISIIHCSENITNDEKPVTAMKRKKNSPFVVGANLVKEKKADAFISSGSTGALLTAGTLIVGRIKGILRPALIVAYPTVKKPMILLDLGANANVKPEYLNQFAFMGSSYSKAIFDTQNPSVGLANIGTEETKGSTLYQETHKLLKENKKINFYGNVEGRDIPSGVVDVLVCDGFTGNIVLKLTEGVAIGLMKLIKQSLMSSLKSKLGAILAKDGLKKVKSKFDYEEYGGAMLIGIDGIVVKAHGSSNAKAFYYAINQAKKTYDAKVVDSIKEMAKEFADMKQEVE